MGGVWPFERRLRGLARPLSRWDVYALFNVRPPRYLFSREGGSPVWVPAFAGKQGCSKEMAAKPIRSEPRPLQPNNRLREEKLAGHRARLVHARRV